MDGTICALDPLTESIISETVKVVRLNWDLTSDDGDDVTHVSVVHCVYVVIIAISTHVKNMLSL